jgi:hypothetical protein
LLDAYHLGLTAPHSAAEAPNNSRRKISQAALRRDELAVLQFLLESV